LPNKNQGIEMVNCPDEVAVFPIRSWTPIGQGTIHSRPHDEKSQRTTWSDRKWRVLWQSTLTPVYYCHHTMLYHLPWNIWST